MEKDQRIHPRFCPNDLLAKITIAPEPPQKKINFEGTVVDMSYTGIKIKLNTPINTDITEAEIIIKLTMPESGIPVSITGNIKHLNNESEYGLQYSEKCSEQDIDNLMFECIKKVDNSGKTS